MRLSNNSAFVITDIQRPYLWPSDDGFTYFDIGAADLIIDIQKTAKNLCGRTEIIYLFSEPDYSVRASRDHWRPNHFRPFEHGLHEHNRYDIPSGFTVNRASHLVSKIESSAFQGPHESRFDQLLKELNISHLTFAGVNTDVCVFETARDAAMKGYKVEIALNLCRDIATGSDEGARRTRLLARMAKDMVNNVGIITL